MNEWMHNKGSIDYSEFGQCSPQKEMWIWGQIYSSKQVILEHKSNQNQVSMLLPTYKWIMMAFSNSTLVFYLKADDLLQKSNDPRIFGWELF